MKAKILVVEDERIVAMDIQRCLERLGYEVLEIATTSAEAIEITGRIRPDLILMDMVLKGVRDGISTAREIKLRYDIPVIYLTSYEDKQTLERAKPTEPIGYILKPFAEQDLHAAIEMGLYKHEMERKLRRAYQELKLTQRTLIQAEKLAALGRFSSGLTHEIRNPLANISASAQLCLRKYSGDTELRRYIEIILRNSRTADNIIKELLDFASPRKMDFNPGSINKIFKRILALIRARCEEQGVSIEVQVPEALPEINMNEKRLEEAFLNMISNSIEAMPAGGILRITCHNNANRNEVIITIEDTGHGISAEDKDKVFEPFYTTKDSGTGLGLSIAYQTIKSHSGKVSLESEAGKGTRVEIRLPITSKGKTERQEPGEVLKIVTE